MLAIEDAGTFQLIIESGVGRCAPSTRPPDLEIQRAGLGSLYLGGATPSRLARADRIRGEPAALALADRAFAWPVAPWCPEQF